MANTTIYPYGTDGQLPSSIGVINDLTTGGADKALSAEMGKKLRQNVDRVQAIYRRCLMLLLISHSRKISRS